MSQPLPQGVSPSGKTLSTIRHFVCERCGKRNEILLRGFVPAHYYNAVANFCRAAAGDEFVLLPVSTLNAMGEERERQRDEIIELQKDRGCEREGRP